MATNMLQSPFYSVPPDVRILVLRNTENNTSGNSVQKHRNRKKK
jgi:hypothetical protein